MAKRSSARLVFPAPEGKPRDSLSSPKRAQCMRSATTPRPTTAAARGALSAVTHRSRHSRDAHSRLALTLPAAEEAMVTGGPLASSAAAAAARARAASEGDVSPSASAATASRASCSSSSSSSASSPSKRHSGASSPSGGR